MHVPLSCFMLKLAFPVAGQGGREGTNGMETLKAIGRKWNDISLIKRILVGLVIGAVLGVFWPGNDVLEMFGTLFVSALKGVAPILVFFLVISALANAKGAGAMKVVVILYLAATFIAAFVAVLMSSLFPVDLTLAAAQDTSAAPSDIGSVFSKLLLSIASNPVDALTNANYLGILAWAVLLGIALRHAKDGVKEVFASISDAVSQVVRWIDLPGSVRHHGLGVHLGQHQRP